jgi:serine/threonine protein kinase
MSRIDGLCGYMMCAQNEYISNGFFQQPTHVSLSQSVVLQLLAGLAHVAAAGVVMRDVKPDNGASLPA